ncbi:MAG: phasin family protein [Burkholderiaceae bacterium]|jgi:poly(hydroxyalkanoate) granule-associated protein|nr:phasin family protein [Burkholderiaceae bacterium]
MTSASKTDDSTSADGPLWQPPPGLPEPARQVWLAGLGALSRAQAEGGKAFEALVRQGLALQTQASQVAQQRIAEAAQAATQPWQHLGGLSGIFEDRVARALAHLGLPTAQDWATWQTRLQALEATLQDVLRAAPQTASRPAAAESAAQPPAPASATAKRPAPKNLSRAKVKLRAPSVKKTRTPPSP